MGKLNVKYINAYPGMGKTYWSVGEMTSALIQGADSIIYVSPTNKLLTEVYESLAERLPTGLLKNVKQPNVDQKFNYELNKDLPTVQRTHDWLSNKENWKGKVFLLTHECFVRLPKTDNYRKYRVFFDEARKVVSQTKTVQLKSSVEARTLKSALDPSAVPGYFQLKENGKKLVQTATYTHTGKINYQQLYSAISLFEDARMNSYVRVKEAGRGISLSVFTVLDPVRLFSGFREVTLLASHFNESQMFYVLKANPKVKLRDISFVLTKTPAGAQRYKEIKKRYSKVTIYPIIRSPVPLSKRMMDGDLLVPLDCSEALREFVLISVRRLRALLREKEELYETLKHQSAKELKLTELDLRALKTFKDVEVVNQEFLPWMLNNSLSLASYLARKRSKSIKPGNNLPLLVLNSDRPELKELKYIRQTVMMSLMNHGLNEYQDQNIIIFLAAVNPAPEMTEFLKSLVPEYTPGLDHIADICNQSVCRTCVRSPESQAEVHVIVSDTEVAKMLQSKMLGRPKIEERVVDQTKPPNMTNMGYVYTNMRVKNRVKAREENEARKTAAAEKKKSTQKEFYALLKSTPEWRALNSASACYSRAVKTGSYNEDRFQARKEAAQETFNELRRSLAKEMGVKLANNITPSSYQANCK